MKPTVEIQLTGKALLIGLLLMLATLAVLALIWLIVGPGAALIGGFGAVLLVKGLLALLSPS